MSRLLNHWKEFEANLLRGGLPDELLSALKLTYYQGALDFLEIGDEIQRDIRPDGQSQAFEVEVEEVRMELSSLGHAIVLKKTGGSVQ